MNQMKEVKKSERQKKKKQKYNTNNSIKWRDICQTVVVESFLFFCCVQHNTNTHVWWRVNIHIYEYKNVCSSALYFLFCFSFCCCSLYLSLSHSLSTSLSHLQLFKTIKCVHFKIVVVLLFVYSKFYFFLIQTKRQRHQIQANILYVKLYVCTSMYVYVLTSFVCLCECENDLVGEPNGKMFCINTNQC